MTSEAGPPAQDPTGPRAEDRTPIARNARRRSAALAGHRGDEAAARALVTDDDPGVRATALRALARSGHLRAADAAAAAADPAPEVRRAAAETIAADHGLLQLDDPSIGAVLAGLLGDADATVVEVAAWASGEWVGRALESGFEPAGPDLVTPLSAVTTDHADALCREAAVAALGAIGDEGALGVILAATGDKATVRRRAVIALAPFDGDEVTAALERARTDRDWQVRQAAEDLLRVDDDADLEDDPDDLQEDPDDPDPDPDGVGVGSDGR
jgi:HEAT repeat protein